MSTSLQDTKLKNTHNYNNSIFSPSRGEIIDKNGEILAKNIRVYHAAIKPNLIKNKKNFILKLQLMYPDLDLDNIKKKIKKNKYFYLKKNITKEEQLKLWYLGEKGILFETTETRIYPHKNLFSHVIGQIDLDNNGISGLEKYFNQNLINIDNLLSR